MTTAGHDPDGNRYDMMHNGGYQMMNGGGGGWLIGFAVLTLVLLLIALMAMLANLFLHVSRQAPAGPGSAAAPEARLVLDARRAAR